MAQPCTAPSLHHMRRWLERRLKTGANRSEGLRVALRAEGPERQLGRLVLTLHLKLIRDVLHQLLELLQLLQTDVFDLLELLKLLRHCLEQLDGLGCGRKDRVDGRSSEGPECPVLKHCDLLTECCRVVSNRGIAHLPATRMP